MGKKSLAQHVRTLYACQDAVDGLWCLGFVIDRIVAGFLERLNNSISEYFLQQSVSTYERYLRPVSYLAEVLGLWSGVAWELPVVGSSRALAAWWHNQWPAIRLQAGRLQENNNCGFGLLGSIRHR